ncbi:MAG: DNA-binding protein [Desulfocapsa sp.]|nr:MAG: DNA-binding protein [Desulfocapsa sp.]
MEQNCEEKTIMRPDQAAEYIGLSKSTLAKMRVRGDGPVFVKFGNRAVAYLKQDIDDYVMVSRRKNTSESGVK